MFRVKKSLRSHHFLFRLHVSGTKKMEYKTRQWHEKCFCCVVCKNPIGTKSFIPREQEIYCAGCYEDKFATRCVKCNKVGSSPLLSQRATLCHGIAPVRLRRAAALKSLSSVTKKKKKEKNLKNNGLSTRPSDRYD